MYRRYKKRPQISQLNTEQLHVFDTIETVSDVRERLNVCGAEQILVAQAFACNPFLLEELCVTHGERSIRHQAVALGHGELGHKHRKRR